MRAVPGRRLGVCLGAGLTALWAGAMLTAQGRIAQPGDPLAGLTPREFEEFRLGLDDFLEVETAEEGLGPAFNGTSCASCHNVPAVGGVSAVAEVRAAWSGADGAYQAFGADGESLYHLFSIPTHGCQPTIPPEANVIVRRVPIPLFGAGLVEAIDDDTILALADAQARGRDGVSGRAAIVIDRGTGERRVGRFGWKAQHATLLAFGADAYRNEMGITNDLFPGEIAVGVDESRMRVCDPIPDPEDVADPRTRRRGIDNFASFMRFLAPVGRGPVDEVARVGEAAGPRRDPAARGRRHEASRDGEQRARRGRSGAAVGARGAGPRHLHGVPGPAVDLHEHDGGAAAGGTHR